MSKTKTCTNCKKELPVEQFHKNGESLRSKCKRCRRLVKLKQKYDLNQVDYQKMMHQQQGACKICGYDKMKHLHIDHCHTTGEVRGILCRWCNIGLGKFKDNTELLRKAAEYLDESRHAKFIKVAETGIAGSNQGEEASSEEEPSSV